MKTYPYGRQFITEEDIEEVAKVLRGDYITTGPVVSSFEKEFARKVNARYAVAFNSGTSALHGAYFALGLKPGKEFITSPITFVATGNAGLFLGHTPVFCDVEPETGNIDTRLIEKNITEKTRFIVPVHFAGHPADMKEIKQLADKYDLKVIEDAAHATGAKYEDHPVGDCRYSDMAIFSFHPVKHITTGEGGMVVTNDESYYKRLASFRTHGIRKTDLENQDEGDWYYEMHHLGFNYRLTDIQAALGASQLKRLDSNIQRRREIAMMYHEKFSGNPYFDLPVERANVRSAWHLYPIKLKEPLIGRKKEIFNSLREAGLGVQTHYIPVHLQPYYRHHGYDGITLPAAEKFYRSEISIPMYHSLVDDDVEEIVKRILEVFNNISG